MIFRSFQDLNVSLLGFGTMRLPCDGNGHIDEAATADMLEEAIQNGVNYYDTAYPYHEGMSEIVIGKLLKKYPRDSYFLADKFPGHQLLGEIHPAEVFEEQLHKCNVDYFDFYLLHNVYENDMDIYCDESIGIIPYLIEQKKKGRIRHLGFSCHARPDTLEAFLDRFGDEMEFCQIQMNYLDWNLQDAKNKWRILHERKVPIIVMEPVRGGALTKHKPEDVDILRGFRPDESIAAWSFRWLQSVPGVLTILSGMSNMEQLKDNLKTFQTEKPLTSEENQTIMQIAKGMADSVPCTGCRYCVDGCQAHLNIPMLIQAYNDVHFNPDTALTVSMQLDALTEDELPMACAQCGACVRVCPQKINIPKTLAMLSKAIPTLPNWKKICEEREIAAKNAK